MKCERCKGKGKIRMPILNILDDCPDCNGTGNQQDFKKYPGAGICVVNDADNPWPKMFEKARGKTRC